MKLSSIFPHGAGVKLMALGAISLMAILLAAGSAKACSYSGAQQVFKPWGDSRNYVLGPDGGFEAGAQGWTLSGGATPVGGNESYYLNGRTDAQSLYLPGGSSAISPPVCMSLDTPVSACSPATRGTRPRVCGSKRPTSCSVCSGRER